MAFYPMKQIISVLSLVLVAFSSLKAQQAAAPAPASIPSSEVIELTEPTYDFGKIPQGRPVTHLFQVINKGREPLILDNVQASCGCTTPEWSELPIPPGGSSIIKVGFNAASEGKFTKTITIKYRDSWVKTFTISGDVYPTPTTSAPLNSSLSLLK